MSPTIHKMNYTVEKNPDKPFSKRSKPKSATGEVARFRISSRIPYIPVLKYM